ncbi:MAG: hypothetical protein ACRD2J_04725 [Thermoanaerobaculia bacterium]
MLALLLATGARGEIIDRVAAVVDRQVITLSEVNQVIEVRLFERQPAEEEDAYRRRVLDAMIAQVLRYRDVERFGAQDVSADSIEAVVQEVIGRFPSEQDFAQALARAELTLDEVRTLIKRQLQVQAYIEERFAPLIFVSLEQVETYYRDIWAPQRRARGLPVPPLADVSDEIRRLIRGDQLDEEIARWTEQLRSRANVDVFVYR